MDAALLTELCYGTLQRQITLDFFSILLLKNKSGLIPGYDNCYDYLSIKWSISIKYRIMPLLMKLFKLLRSGE